MIKFTLLIIALLTCYNAEGQNKLMAPNGQIITVGHGARIVAKTLVTDSVFTNSLLQNNLGPAGDSIFIGVVGGYSTVAVGTKGASTYTTVTNAGIRCMSVTLNGNGGTNHLNGALGIPGTQYYLPSTLGGGVPVTLSDSVTVAGKAALVHTHAPTVMSAASTSALVSPAYGLEVNVNTTNGTFISTGLWRYNGTIWKLVSAD